MAVLRDISTYQFGIGFAIVTPLLLLWVIGAVGLIGAEGDPLDRWYGMVIAIEAIGALIARRRARFLSRTMLVAASTQGLVTILALIVGKQHVDASSVGEILGINGFFIVLWLSSALLFREAPKEKNTANTSPLEN